jgi:hypothetical protein
MTLQQLELRSIRAKRPSSQSTIPSNQSTIFAERGPPGRARSPAETGSARGVADT